MKKYWSYVVRTVVCLFLFLWACEAEEQEEGEGKVETAVADSTAADSTKTDSTSTDSTLADSLRIDAVPVEVALAARGDISSFLLFTSNIETEAAIDVYPQTAGHVEAVYVEEGDRIAAGDTLLHIEDASWELTRREWEIELNHLEKGFKRTEEMYRRRLISDQDYEAKKYELEKARVNKDKAELSIKLSYVRAPFAGVITARHVQVGDRVGESVNLFSLIKLDDMIANVYVPGQYLTTVAPRQQAVITSDFLPEREFVGWVKRISPVIDPKSGTFKVVVGIKDRWQYLRPGLSVNVQVVTDTHVDAVLVPKEAVVYDGEDRYVFVVEDSTASRIELDAGYENAKHIESLQHIAAGAPIIVVGQYGLRDQARVKVINQDSELAAEMGTAER